MWVWLKAWDPVEMGLSPRTSCGFVNELRSSQERMTGQLAFSSRDWKQTSPVHAGSRSSHFLCGASRDGVCPLN